MLSLHSALLSIASANHESAFQIQCWVISATLLLLFAIIPQIPFFFSRLFGFVSTSNFVLVVVIALMLIKLFHQSCSISRLTYKVESLSATIALHDKDLRDEKNLDSITDFNHAARV